MTTVAHVTDEYVVYAVRNRLSCLPGHEDGDEHGLYPPSVFSPHAPEWWQVHTIGIPSWAPGFHGKVLAS